MARPFRGDEQRVDTARWFHLAKVNIEAMGAHQDIARLQMGSHVSAINVSLNLIGEQNVDEVGFPHRLFDRLRVKAMTLRQVIIGTAGSLADDYFAAAIAKVLCLSVSLRAVAKD